MWTPLFERYRVSQDRAIPLDPRPSEDEALLAQPLGTVIYALKKIPHLIDKIDASYPEPGAAPPAPPLAEVELLRPRRGLGYFFTGLIAATAGALLALAAVRWF